MSNNTALYVLPPPLPSSGRYLVMANDSIQPVSAPGSRLQTPSCDRDRDFSELWTTWAALCIQAQMHLYLISVTGRQMQNKSKLIIQDYRTFVIGFILFKQQGTLWKSDSMQCIFLQEWGNMCALQLCLFADIMSHISNAGTWDTGVEIWRNLDCGPPTLNAIPLTKVTFVAGCGNQKSVS